MLRLFSPNAHRMPAFLKKQPILYLSLPGVFASDGEIYLHDVDALLARSISNNCDSRGIKTVSPDPFEEPQYTHVLTIGYDIKSAIPNIVFRIGDAAHNGIAGIVDSLSGAVNVQVSERRNDGLYVLSQTIDMHCDSREVAVDYLGSAASELLEGHLRGKSLKTVPDSKGYKALHP